MSRSKSIGTAAETAVVRWLQSIGAGEAERLVLRGSQDWGDVRCWPGLHLEVKAGNAAHTASRSQCESWLVEAEREGEAAKARCFLVVKKKGTTDVGRWRFFCRARDLNGNPRAKHLIELSVRDAFDIIANRGLVGTPNRQGMFGLVGVGSL